jgi:hypothetical protein
MTDRHAEFWAGVGAGMVSTNDDKCPEDASEAYQRGYGMGKAGKNVEPPIELDKFEEHFQRVFR